MAVSRRHAEFGSVGGSRVTSGFPALAGLVDRATEAADPENPPQGDQRDEQRRYSECELLSHRERGDAIGASGLGEHGDDQGLLDPDARRRERNDRGKDVDPQYIEDASGVGMIPKARSMNQYEAARATQLADCQGTIPVR